MPHVWFPQAHPEPTPRITVLHIAAKPAVHALATSAFADAGARADYQRLRSGRDVLDYIEGNGAYSDQPPKTRPDLILLDVHIEDGSGFSALRALKSHESLSTIPVIAFTRSLSPSEYRAAVDAGVDAYIDCEQSPDRIAYLFEALGDLWRSARS